LQFENSPSGSFDLLANGVDDGGHGEDEVAGQQGARGVRAEVHFTL